MWGNTDSVLSILGLCPLFLKKSGKKLLWLFEKFSRRKQGGRIFYAKVLVRNILCFISSSVMVFYDYSASNHSLKSTRCEA